MSVSAKSIRIDNDSLWVSLSDGRTIGAPLVWYPRLLKATEAERLNYSISQQGVHWEAIDEDISVEGLLAGKGGQDQQSSPTTERQLQLL